MNKFKGLNFQAFLILHQGPQTQPIFLCWYCNQCIKNDCYNWYSHSLSVYKKLCIWLCTNWALTSTSNVYGAIPVGGNWVPERVNDLLHVKELLTNRNGLLTPNLGLFLLNYRGFHDKFFFKIEIKNRTKPWFIDSQIVFPLSGFKMVLSHITYIFRGRRVGETVMIAK